MFQSGVLIPDMTRLGAFPFSISEEISGIYNVSGWTGPVKNTSNQPIGGVTAFSGMVGPGTYYPASGSLEELLRLFWGVRSWTLNTKQLIGGASSTQVCDDLFLGLADITLSYSVLGTLTKTLTLLDYYNHNHQNGIQSVFTAPTGAASNSATCVPLDPIQKFDDLLCRKKYFTWMPDTGSIAAFKPQTTGLFQGVHTPYADPNALTLYREASFPNTCYIDWITPLQTLFCLSIMSPDFLAYSGMALRTGTVWNPPLYSDSGNYNNFYGNQWESGDALTNPWGQVTGYGTGLYPSGNIPVVFHRNYYEPTDPQYISSLNPPNYSGYFPLIYFYLKVASNEGATSLFNLPASSFITTLMPASGAQRVGTLRIYDSNLVNNLGQPILNTNAVTGLPAKLMYQCPLWGSSILQWLFADVELTPDTFWLSSSGTRI